MKVQKSFKNNQPTLYIIPTPIGNLEDITIRTLNTLKAVEVLYCEDKRVTQKLLNRYEIQVTTKTYHEYNKEQMTQSFIRDLEQCGNVGLVSDAGMPGISDPGFDIIKKVTELNYNVVVLPGASAFLVALIRANFPNNEFKYYGFLGTNKRLKTEKLNLIIHGKETAVFYESPHKLLSTLKTMSEINSEVQITVARELTKLNEEYIKGSVLEIYEHFSENPIKGEFVIVVEPIAEKCEEFELSIEDHVYKLIDLGQSKNDAIKEVAKMRKMKKNEVYKLFIE